jgi:N-acetyl-anhydromuramyl-L-alanine amidase AmpD
MPSADDYAREVLRAGRDLGITPRGIVIGFATVSVECDWWMYANSKVPESLNLPHDRVGSDGFSVGLFQQQIVKTSNGYWWADCATCMDPYKSAALFFGRLKKLDYNNTSRSPGSYAQAIQGSAFPDRYDQRMTQAQQLYDRLATGVLPVADPNRPDFNEYPMWSPNSSNRGSTKVDLFLIHTQEGPGNADSLAQYLQGNGVSYHYTISQAADGGVTVVDVVDTDSSAWAVLSANPRSINLCFAGSRAGWTRAEWLQQSKAIDVAAFIAVQDCKKYGIPTKVLAPPYNSNPPGISDHKYVTQWLKDGSHTDVGPNFPWDVFTAAVNKYASGQPATPPPGVPVPPPNVPDYDKETWDQIRGRWAMLGDKTLIEALAEVRDKTCGTTDAGKPGVRF